MKSPQMIVPLVAALLVLAAAGCGTARAVTTTAPPEPITTTTTAPAPITTTTEIVPEDVLDEEYDVYSALIQSMFIDAPRSTAMTQGMFTDAGRPPALIVIEDTTAQPDAGFSPPDAASFAGRQWPELDDEILTDFETKNSAPSVLERSFSLSAEYVLIGEQEIESIFSGNPSGWDDFYAKYPRSQGMLTLSRVGFNEAKDTAVLYAGNQWHGAAGVGNMVLMKKMAGNWTLLGEAMMWMS